MLFFGNFFRGIGFTTYYVIALPYIDDTVHPQSSPIYISIMHGVSLVGRLSGYFFSAYFLSFYETPWSNPGIDQKDPRFIGAWWLGFFVTGILVILTSLPLFFYPSEFKTAKTRSKSSQVCFIYKLYLKLLSVGITIRFTQLASILENRHFFKL